VGSGGRRGETRARAGGLDALLRRRWTLEEAFRVAEAVGIDFRGTLAVVERHAA